MIAGGWAVYKFKPLPEGKVIANQTAMDSLAAFIIFADSVKNLDLTPDTVRVVDTIYLGELDEAVTTPSVEVNPLDTTVFIVKDSLVVDDNVHAWVSFKIKGYIVDNQIKWRYRPVIRTISTTVEIPVHIPLIQTIERKVPTHVTGHYLSAIGGGNAEMFTFGIDYDLVKSNRIYGFQYRRYGDQNVYGLKIGINLSTLFKKTR